MDDLIRIKGDHVEVMPDKRKMRRIALRLVPMLVVLVIVRLFFGVVVVAFSFPLFILDEVDFLACFAAFMFVAMFIRIQLMNKPIITLAPEGIYVHSAMHDIGLIYWEEIANIYEYSHIYYYVGIVPHDVRAIGGG